jgi:type III pantothenate kinase
MNISVDIGNSAVKIGYFVDNKLTEKKFFLNREIIWSEIIPEDTTAVIISASGRFSDELLKYLHQKKIVFHTLTHTSKIPITLDYKTPETLGLDRVAGAVGAETLFPGQPSLVIDAGTALTFGFISNSCFQGGNISPGLSLRYRSLHEHTARLPLLGVPQNEIFFGKSTTEAIESGVFNGFMYEIEGTIQRFESLHGNINIILTGGDSQFFVSKIKKTIFAEPNLVLIGLNRILTHNV